MVVAVCPVHKQILPAEMLAQIPEVVVVLAHTITHTIEVAMEVVVL
jgi:hypothetical protein